MEAAPMICPACGELIIVSPQLERDTVMIPLHLDRVMPLINCVASSRAVVPGMSRLP